MKQKASLTQIAAKPRPSQQRSPAPMFQSGAVHQRSSWECSLSVNGRKSAHKNATNPNAIDATATARNIQTQRFMAAITFAGLVRVKHWRARRRLVGKLRDRSRPELRLLFVPTMTGNDFRPLAATRTAPIRAKCVAIAVQPIWRGSGLNRRERIRPTPDCRNYSSRQTALAHDNCRNYSSRQPALARDSAHAARPARCAGAAVSSPRAAA